MPTYEFRCPTCDTVFEERRPMSESSAPATCADGHEAVRLLSRVMVLRASGGPSPSATPAAAPCHSACACH